MIYDLEDRQIIARTQVRKSIEAASIHSADDIEPRLRTMIEEQLFRDIDRCGFMLRLADNDFGLISEDIRDISDNHQMLPPEIYKVYLDRMDDESRDDEGRYLMLFTYAVAYMPMLSTGLSVASTILSADTTVPDREAIMYRKAYILFEDAMRHCGELLDEEDVPYVAAYEFAECALEECSIILRIAGGKEVPTDEISLHMEWADTQDPKVFVDVIACTLTGEEKAVWDSFMQWEDKRTCVMIGRCIANMETEGIMYGPDECGYI